ncbi:hypothetical protein Q1695_002544 [Nippostrongylus brasiliensis]|nr:hypothetical protein Q1695_002544 [Nippostrongylus brasiliensis]
MLRTVLLLLTLAEVLNCSKFTMEIFNFQNYSELIHPQRSNFSGREKRATQNLITYWNTYYLGYVTIGTPGQGFYLLMDSGSSSIWVASGGCNSPACLGSGSARKNKKRFNWWLSSTFKLAMENFKFYYGTGEVSGFVGIDNVNIGGVTVAGQKFGIATEISHWGSTPVGGIFGMGFPKLYAVASPMQNFVRGLPSPYWIMWINPAVINPTLGQSTGLISFGQLDEKHCRPTWRWVPLSSDSDWQVALSSFQIGSYYVDTTEALLISTRFVDRPPLGLTKLSITLRTLLSTAERHGLESHRQFSTSTRHRKPELKFAIHGIIYGIASNQYIVNLNHGNNRCVLGFMSTGGGRFNHGYILGAPWFRSFCNLFNYRDRNMAFSSSIAA